MPEEYNHCSNELMCRIDMAEEIKRENHVPPFFLFLYFSEH